MTVTVTVGKKTVTALPTLNKTSFVYTGSKITPILTGVDETLYTVTNNGGTNVGNYNVTLTLKDSANYKWSDVSGATKNIGYSITKATTVISGLAIENWTYGTGASTPTATTNFGTIVYTYSKQYGTGYTSTVPTTAGDYYVRAEVAENGNWTAATSDPVAFKILKADPTVTFTPDTPKLDGQYYMNLLDISGNTTATYNGTSVGGSVTASSVTFNGTNSSYSITFTPDSAHSANFNEVTVTGNINLKTVARIGVNGTAYGTIEDAVAAAKSGDVVWVVTDSSDNVRITKDLEIPAGVTLLIPYGNSNNASGRNQNDKSTLKYETDKSVLDELANKYEDTYEMTSVILAAGKKLTVKGTLEISGQLSGGGGGQAYSGHTAGKYGTLKLEDGAKVDIYGTAKVYGFIDDINSTSNGVVTVYAGGSVYEPFVLRDFKGGSLMKAIYSDFDVSGSAPFNQIQVVNVSSRLRMYYGANMYNYCNLYASYQHNSAVGHMIGTGGFIELTDSTYSYLEAKYDPDTDITDLRIYGGAKVNSMQLSVLGITINSYEYRFSLSWLQHITLDNNEEKGQTETAKFSMPYNFKMLPGAVLIVEEGAELNVKSLSIYETFVDTVNNGSSWPGIYPSIYPASSKNKAGQAVPGAKLLVRGTLIAEELGGDVYTDVGDAKVKVTKLMTIETSEPTLYVGSLFSTEITEYQYITRTLRLIYGNNVYSSLELGKAYKSNAPTETWTVSAELLTLKLPKGVHITINKTVLTDSQGNIVGYGSYDSSEGGTVIVIEGTEVIFNLKANQLYIDNGNTQVEISISDRKTSSYTEKWLASSTIPDIYEVPTFSIEGMGKITSSKLKYVLDNKTMTGHIELYLEKKVSGSFSNKAEFTVTAGNSSTTGTGTYSKSASWFGAATASTTVCIYENDSIEIT